MDVYETITKAIVSDLRDGTVPWFKKGVSRKWNYATGTPYGGVNLLLLPKTGGYLTPSQVSAMGGKVKQGATVYLCVFKKKRWVDPLGNTYTSKDFVGGYPTQGEMFELSLREDIILRTYQVYHVSDVEGIEEKTPPQFSKLDMRFLGKAVGNIYRGESFYYDINTDYASVKDPDSKFEILKLAVMKTAHPSRMNRKGAGESRYMEDLVSDIGAGILLDMMDGEMPSPSSEYCNKWINMLENRPYLIWSSSETASECVEYILRNAKEKEVIQHDNKNLSSHNGEVYKKSDSVHPRILARRGGGRNNHTVGRVSGKNRADIKWCVLPLPYEVIALIIGFIIAVYIMGPITEYILLHVIGLLSL